MLTNGMRETFQREVTLSERKSSVLARLLDFFYTGVCEVKDVGEALELAQAADFFQCDVLAATCMQLIRANVAPENCVAVLVAVRAGLFAGSRDTALVAMEAMEKQVFVVLRHNFEVVVETDTLHYLDIDTLEAVLKSPLLRSEEASSVMKVVVQWLRWNLNGGVGVGYDASSVMAVVHRMLSCVRLASFTRASTIEWTETICDMLEQVKSSVGLDGRTVMRRVIAVMGEIEDAQMAEVQLRKCGRVPRNHCDVDVTRLQYVGTVPMEEKEEDAMQRSAGQGIAAAGDVLVIVHYEPQGRVEVRNADTFAQVALLEGHEDPICAVEFLPSCNSGGPLRLVSASTGQGVAMRVWNMEDYTCEREVAVADGEGVRVLCATVESGSGAMLLVSGHWDGSARVWNTEAWEVVRTLSTDQGDGNEVTAICCDDDDGWLVWGTYGGDVHVWSIGGAVAEWECAHTVQLPNSINQGCMLLYAGFLWCGIDDEAAECISLSTWARQKLPKLGNDVTLLVACADGRLLSGGFALDMPLQAWAIEVIEVVGGRVQLTRHGKHVMVPGGTMGCCVLAHGRRIFVPDENNVLHVLSDNV